MSTRLLADLILPTIFGHIFSFVLVIWIVIAIEAAFIYKMLKISYAKSYWICTRANIYSTLVGIPFAWFLSFFISLPISFLVENLEKNIPEVIDYTRIFFLNTFSNGNIRW